MNNPRDTTHDYATNLQEQAESEHDRRQGTDRHGAMGRESSSGRLLLVSGSRHVTVPTTGLLTVAAGSEFLLVGSLDGHLNFLAGDGLSVYDDAVIGGALGDGDEFTALNVGNSVLDHILAESPGESHVGGDVLEDGVVLGRALGWALGDGGILGDRDLFGRLGVRILERDKVVARLDLAVRGDVDDSVVVGLLGVFVDETSSEHASHLVGVQGVDLLPLAWGGLVAAELGEEHGERVAAVILDELVVSGALEGVVATPLVAIEMSAEGTNTPPTNRATYELTPKKSM